jgi:toxin HigB-1
MLIQSFGDKRTERLFNDSVVKDFAGLAARAKRKLESLHAAVRMEDLRVPPSNRLEKLRGDRQGFHSIRINDQWRIVFRWVENNAHEVSIVDYH